MPIQSTFVPHKTFVLVTNTGSNTDYEESMAYVRGLLQAARAAGVHQLLVDDRSALHSVPKGAVYQVADAIQAALGPAMVRRVAVLPSFAELETTHLFALLMNNRGMRMELFESIELAQAWLEKDPA